MPPFIQSVFHDVRIAVRQLLRQPTIALGIVLTLALGISANTSMFALADALLFKPPVAADPARLIAISGGDARGAFNPLSYPDYLAIRQQARTLDGVMAFSGADVALGGVVPERLRAMLVSGNYFGRAGRTR